MSLPSLHDFILAYRKVKTELWWRYEVPSLRLLADYEKDLVANLSRLRTRLEAGFQPDSEFLGSVYYLPKSIIPKEGKGDPIHFRELSDRRASNKKEGSDFRIELRQLAVPSIDFQVLSVLWAMGEGGNIDARRAPSSRANVLRRNFVPEAEGQFPDVETTLRGPVNPHYPGLYRPYFNAYKNWRNDGLKVARKALENGQRVFALTMDLRRYYHQIDAKCLEDKLGTGIIAEALVKSLIDWQERFGEPERAQSPELDQAVKRGIPVGLIASGLIANLLLDPLDQAIECRLSPLYYGRYVDDLFLVVALSGEFSGGEAVLADLARLLHGNGGHEPAMIWHKADTGNDGDKEGRIEFQFARWGNSRLEAKPDKQRIFSLQGRKGQDLLAVLDQELIENSSEWRMVTDLDPDDANWLKEMLVASHDASEGATTLRRTDDLSIRRLGIALSLRKLESIERFSLKPGEWFSPRENFYRVAESHLLTPEGLCDFWPRLPRLFGLVFANADWKAANRMLTRLIAIKPFFDSAEILSRWKENEERDSVEIFVPWFREMLKDELQKSCLESPNGNEAMRFFKRCRDAFGFSHDPFPDQQALNKFRDLDLDRDGHRARFRRGQEFPLPSAFKAAIQRIVEFFDSKEETLPDGLQSWLLPTRPFGEQEGSVIWPETIVDLSKMRECLFALRGQSRFAGSSKQNEPPDAHSIKLSQEFLSHSIRIAITNYLTKESSWRASVRGKPDLSISRLKGLLSFLNDFLRTIQKQSWKEKPLYFCLPELSIPREWIFPVAQYLAQARVSLIAGVEYERQGALEHGVVVLAKQRTRLSSNICDPAIQTGGCSGGGRRAMEGRRIPSIQSRSRSLAGLPAWGVRLWCPHLQRNDRRGTRTKVPRGG